MSIENLFEYKAGEYQTVTRMLQYPPGSGVVYIRDPNRVKMAGYDIEIWDAETGGTQLVLDTDYTLGLIDADITLIEGFAIYGGYQIINVAYQAIELFITAKIVGGYTTRPYVATYEKTTANVTATPSSMDDSLYADSSAGTVAVAISNGEYENQQFTVICSGANPVSISGAGLPAQAYYNVAITFKWFNDMWFRVGGSAGAVFSGTVAQIIQYSKSLGELYYTDTHTAPSAYDDLFPDQYWPALCLNAIDSQITLDVANWPELVPHLRAKAITYRKGLSGEKTDLDVTNWNVTTNVGTLTFANTAAENAILAAMLEDKVVHGSYSNWRTVTLSATIGNIPAGDYAISAIDTTLRTVTFAVTASDGSGAVTATSSFYHHRIAGSTTTARVFEASDRAIMSEAEDGSVISGLRHRDAMQRITGTVVRGTDAIVGVADGAFWEESTTNSTAPTVGSYLRKIVRFDNALSTSPNTAKTDDEKTKPKALGAFLYIWGRTYVA